MAGQGFRDLLISSQLTDKRKIQRLARLAERGAWDYGYVCAWRNEVRGTKGMFAPVGTRCVGLWVCARLAERGAWD